MAAQLGLMNPLEQLLNKERSAFNRADLIRVMSQFGIEFVNFHYTGLDGKLKALRIPIQSQQQADSLLADGERVDGSSLFKGMVDTSVSDLYVVPEYRTAFLDPFEDNTMSFVCRFLDRAGNPAPFAPDNILRNAVQKLKESSGLELYALGELEFFMLYKALTPEEDGYPLERQKGYHATSPFVKSGDAVQEMVRHIARISGTVKYAHSEVGAIRNLASHCPELDGSDGEQWEIEFLPAPVEQMADDLVVARWIIRNVAQRHGFVATFAPKLEEGVAGNGYHFHTMLKKNGKSVMLKPDGNLSDEANRLIGGLCRYAASLTAFGNTVSSAYMRLVPGQEAPTKVCWSDLNRNAMIRVPLGWRNVGCLGDRVNPDVAMGRPEHTTDRQTVELRTADGSALTHLILAGITLAANWGMANSEQSMDVAERFYVKPGTPNDSEQFSMLPDLPRSCVESARFLDEEKALYTGSGVFPEFVLDYVEELLSAEKDEDINSRLGSLPADQRLAESLTIMHRSIHRH